MNHCRLKNDNNDHRYNDRYMKEQLINSDHLHDDDVSRGLLSCAVSTRVPWQRVVLSWNPTHWGLIPSLTTLGPGHHHSQ